MELINEGVEFFSLLRGVVVVCAPWGACWTVVLASLGPLTYLPARS